MLLVLLFNAREEFKVAQEEGKIPTNILKEDDWNKWVEAEEEGGC